ncbi:MAG TPA: DUF1963 domain-containing protein [Longimicrobium sp.]
MGAVFAQLEALRRTPMVAQIGGFRPSEAPHTSWIGHACAPRGEGLPEWNGRPLYPVLQINTSELPSVPRALEGTAVLALFMDLDDLPFDRPHGDGWVIREYASEDGLQPVLAPAGAAGPRAFPIRWAAGDPEGPSWDDAFDLVDLDSIGADDAVADEFHDRFGNWPGTKVGGYPSAIQHEVGLADYVFQVGSEEKAQWDWVDSGIAYFFKSADGEWRWACQFC